MTSDVPATGACAAGLSRRHALAGAALAGLGAPALAACAGGERAGAPDGASPGSGLSGPLAATADIPEGGGVIFDDEGVVVTQPTAGEFKAFSSTCTHQGCAVTQVTDAIECGCHGSSFALTDGAPLGGPASVPLPEVPISVEDGRIVLG